jgi:hypothetical protein
LPFFGLKFIHTYVVHLFDIGSKGKRKRLRVGAGTKSSCGGGVLSSDDHTQSHPDSASKTPWTPRYLSDLKSSNIYNRNAIEAPAEVEFFTAQSCLFKTVTICVIICISVVSKRSYFSYEITRL